MERVQHVKGRWYLLKKRGPPTGSRSSSEMVIMEFQVERFMVIDRSRSVKKRWNHFVLVILLYS